MPEANEFSLDTPVSHPGFSVAMRITPSKPPALRIE